jgi:hypothetical protein
VRHTPEWEDTIKMVLWEIECECIDWVKMDQYRVKWRAVVKLRVPEKAKYF